MLEDWPRTIAVALTGASGIQYGLRLLQCLIDARVRVYLLISQAAQVVLKMEAGLDVPARPAEAEHFFSERLGAAPGQLRVFGRQQWTAPVASGSHPPDAMAICPCTTGTLASIAAGLSDDLIDRAADVVLKERRPLILVVRETPFNVIHLENMLRLARAGAVIMPANPGFYFNPRTLDELIEFMVARVLDHLQVPHHLLPRWGDPAAEAEATSCRLGD
ncbi:MULTISPECIES: flavin prenyltransferase UbiX [Thiorhodovibrio]|uniref:flavin prenyltransferase UbiX n=1 Tax=Thiorhodovibrio TaxID=61593 RepID=UPI001913BBAA|nr:MULTISPECIES: flavin prenyltransferase UbiX [Thiorhodovibrio]MBK5967671.1 aromatic acid decarboxylase [Thiorhodovibrio winogradskyi]WPL11619.1 putative aromatic acid decarboxylase [Thiorhodovibrio litoralis]